MARTTAGIRLSIQGNQPSSLSGLLLWLKADAITGLNDGDTIATWVDSSGNVFDATGSGGTTPSYETNELNGLPIVRFSGSNGFQLAANPSSAESSFGTEIFSIFFVAKKLSGTGAYNSFQKRDLISKCLLAEKKGSL